MACPFVPFLIVTIFSVSTDHLPLLRLPSEMPLGTSRRFDKEPTFAYAKIFKDKIDRFILRISCQSALLSSSPIFPIPVL